MIRLREPLQSIWRVKNKEGKGKLWWKSMIIIMTKRIR